MRRRLGAALCVAGGLTLSAAGARYALGAVQADEARTAWDASVARAAIESARASVVPRANGGAIVKGSPVARIVAPKIGLDAIVLEGADDVAMNGGPGHYPGSALPGEAGNAIISAHRDRHFNHLDALTVGDTVTTEIIGRQTRWVVTSRRVIDKDAPALFHTTDATLTLTTCWPMRYIGPAPARLIVTAKPVATTSRETAQ